MTADHAELIDGRALGRKIREQVAAEVEALAGKIPPIKLVSVDVGENPASALYIRNQKRSAESVGITFQHVHLDAVTPEDEIADFLVGLSDDPTVTGVILQRPLPEGVSVRRLQSKIHPDKDIEGLNPANMGYIVIGEPRLVPCTALASIRCLLSTGVVTHGQDVAVIGHSEIVGKPIAFLLLNLEATVTICHVATQDLNEHTRKADVVFVAVGKPGLVTGDMLKPGAIVIDIGINQVPVVDEDGQPVHGDDGKPRQKVVGDVDLESVLPVASHVTPVPGGVGPVTVATLLSNAVCAARLQHKDVVGEPNWTDAI